MKKDQESNMWKLIHEQGELKQSLEQSFPEYDFIIELEEFVKLIEQGIRNIERLSAKLNGDIFTEKNMHECYIENKYNIFAVISLHLSLEEFVFNRVKDIGLIHTHPRSTDWKKKGVTNLVKASRNRIQHGALLEGSFQYDIRTSHHPAGEAVETKFQLFKTEWEKLYQKANIEGKKFYDDVLSKSENPLKVLFEHYKAETEDLTLYLKDEFKKKYSAEWDVREKAISRIDEIEKELDS